MSSRSSLAVVPGQLDQPRRGRCAPRPPRRSRRSSARAGAAACRPRSCASSGRPGPPDLLRAAPRSPRRGRRRRPARDSDLPHLLAQEVVALGLRHLLLAPCSGSAVLQLEDADLVLQRLVHAASGARPDRRARGAPAPRATSGSGSTPPGRPCGPGRRRSAAPSPARAAALPSSATRSTFCRTERGSASIPDRARRDAILDASRRTR